MIRERKKQLEKLKWAAKKKEEKKKIEHKWPIDIIEEQKVFDEIKTNDTEEAKEVSETDMELVIKYLEMPIKDIPFLTDEDLFKPIFEELIPNGHEVYSKNEIELVFEYKYGLYGEHIYKWLYTE